LPRAPLGKAEKVVDLPRGTLGKAEKWSICREPAPGLSAKKPTCMAKITSFAESPLEALGKEVSKKKN